MKPAITHIPEVLETDRIMIRNSILQEAPDLQRLNETSDYLEEWVGWKTPDDYVEKAFKEGNLPPGGKFEDFCMKTIVKKESGEIIGVLEVYHGYPTPDALCIGWFFIHPDYQGKGYGAEVIQLLAAAAFDAGFKRIRLGVHLKNWPALRFWIRAGFDKAIKVVGDEVHRKDANASIILEYAL